VGLLLVMTANDDDPLYALTKPLQKAPPLPTIKAAEATSGNCPS